jgi:branched-chain amino acid transport system substrate-binding protein
MPGPSRRAARGAVAAVCAGVLLAACGGNGGALGGGNGGGNGNADDEAEGPVTVGLLVPTSGVFAPLGEDMTQGFQLFLDQNDGRLGGREVTVQEVDEGGGPDTGIPGAQRLVQQDVDVVVGVVNSAIALGVRDLFNENEVPLVVANAGADDITGDQSSPYVWRTSFANGEVSSALGPLAAQECESAFLLAADYAAGREAAAGFERTFTQAGGTVVGEAFPPFGSTDNFQPFLAQVRQSGADCAYAFFAGSEAVAFTQQWSQFGLKDQVRLLASGFLTEGGVLTAAGEAATGLETSLHYSSELDNERNREFVEAYTAAYDEPPTVYAVQAYDAAQVLDRALEQGTTGPEVLEGLQSIDSVDSPRGEWSFHEGNGPQQTYYLRRVEQVDGQLVNTIVSELASD